MDTDDVAIADVLSVVSHSPHFLIDMFYFDDYYCDYLYYSNRNGVRVTSEALNGLRSTERIWIWA